MCWLCLLSVLCGCLSSSCGYALAGRGSFLPDYIKTIGIPPFVNRTAVFNLETTITEKMRSEFISRGRYQILPAAEGVDAVLTGEVAGASVRPQITTAEDWHVGFEPGPGDNPDDAPRCKPDYCLNLGITWPGLVALEIKDRTPTLSFKSFGAFVAGAAERAKLVGDTDESDPPPV